MKSRSVGAFEAKTHLAQLLDEVEQGAEVHITRRGRPVAVLRAEGAVPVEYVRSLLARFARHRGDISLMELENLRNEGRER